MKYISYFIIILALATAYMLIDRWIGGYYG